MPAFGEPHDMRRNEDQQQHQPDELKERRREDRVEICQQSALLLRVPDEDLQSRFEDRMREIDFLIPVGRHRDGGNGDIRFVILHGLQKIGHRLLYGVLRLHAKLSGDLIPEIDTEARQPIGVLNHKGRDDASRHPDRPGENDLRRLAVRRLRLLLAARACRAEHEQQRHPQRQPVSEEDFSHDLHSR